MEQMIDSWLKEFSPLGRDFGLNKGVARENIDPFLIKIQGSLIVSKALDSTGSFKAPLKPIENIFQPA